MLNAACVQHSIERSSRGWTHVSSSHPHHHRTMIPYMSRMTGTCLFLALSLILLASAPFGVYAQPETLFVSFEIGGLHSIDLTTATFSLGPFSPLIPFHHYLSYVILSNWTHNSIDFAPERSWKVCADFSLCFIYCVA